MQNEKKQRRKASDGAASKSDAPVTEVGKAPWADMKVVPGSLPYLPGSPPESRIGERLSHCRRALDLSIEALSRVTKSYDTEGVSPTSIYRYEAGQVLPGARELRVLAEALATPIHWLVFGTKAPELRSPLEAELDRYLLRRLHDLGLYDVPGDVDQVLAYADKDRKDSEDERRRLLWEAKKPPGKA